MKKFEIIKTVQLILYILIAGTALLTIFRDEELYQTIAADPHVRLLSIVLWLALGLAFLFMFFDFGSYTDLKRENSELDQAVYADALTGVANRYSCDAYLAQYLNKPLPRDMGCITLDLTTLQEINKNEGHEGGDQVIRAFSDILTGAAEDKRVRSAGSRGHRPAGENDHDRTHQECFVGRNGGNKFLVIFRNCTQKKLEAYLQVVEERVKEQNSAREDCMRYTAGSALAETAQVSSLTALVALSDHLAMQIQSEAPEQLETDGLGI